MCGQDLLRSTGIRQLAQRSKHATGIADFFAEDGVQLPSHDVGLFNMTAFDGSLEMYCNNYWEESGKKVRIWTRSTSLLPDHAEFSQRLLAMQFLAEPRLCLMLLHRFFLD